MRRKQTRHEPPCTPSKSQKRASIASRVIRAMNPMQYGKDQDAFKESSFSPSTTGNQHQTRQDRSRALGSGVLVNVA